MAKITFAPVSRVGDDALSAHRGYSRGLGLPEIGEYEAPTPYLAVVGGSPDVEYHLEDLRNWPGDIWAINGTFQWLRSNGIDSILYRIDPLEPPPEDLEGVKRAVLGDFVHPSVFQGITGDKWLARLGSDGYTFQTTAAGTAPILAAAAGYREVTFFGCESSFGDRTHAYKDEHPNRMRVRCGGKDFMTSPQMVMQAEWLAEAVRAFPGFLKLRTGGFLAALVEHGDYDVTHVSPNIIQEKGAA